MKVLPIVVPAAHGVLTHFWPKFSSIVISAGGTSKTTTAAALAVLLARGGTPTHLIDMAPQASLTRAFGFADKTDGLYHALTIATAVGTARQCALLPTRHSQILSSLSAARALRPE